MLTHLSLFSGIGGIDLSAEWAAIAAIERSSIDAAEVREEEAE